MQEYTYYFFEFTTRIFCGILFFFQGYDKLFNVKLKNVVDTFDEEAERKHIPRTMVYISTYYSSFAEFLGGILLLIGILKPLAITLLGFDLIMVAIGFSTLEVMWDMKHVFPRLILLLTIMITPHNWEYFSLKNILSLFYKLPIWL